MRSNLSILFAFYCLAAHACDPAPAVKAADPDTSKPVTVGFAVDPQKLTAGKTATVLVKVRILPLHHIYALNKSGSDNTPTTLQLRLPKGMKLNGGWKVPEPKKGKGKSRIYEDEVVFRATLAIDKSTPPGKHTVKGEMEYQVCDEELCWPPAKLDLAADLEVIASK